MPVLQRPAQPLTSKGKCSCHEEHTLTLGRLTSFHNLAKLLVVPVIAGLLFLIFLNGDRIENHKIQAHADIEKLDQKFTIKTDALQRTDNRRDLVLNEILINLKALMDAVDVPYRTAHKQPE